MLKHSECDYCKVIGGYWRFPFGSGFPLILRRALGTACTEALEVAGIRFNP
ncbi:MAG: hypothetical protein JWR09_3107 [Mucilaginibacter sp.]|nr:hypothetical protein [Mucilaginibacter sp.]